MIYIQYIHTTGTATLVAYLFVLCLEYYDGPVGQFLLSNFYLLTSMLEIIKEPGRAISYF